MLKMIEKSYKLAQQIRPTKKEDKLVLVVVLFYAFSSGKLALGTIGYNIMRIMWCCSPKRNYKRRNHYGSKGYFGGFRICAGT